MLSNFINRHPIVLALFIIVVMVLDQNLEMLL